MESYAHRLGVVCSLLGIKLGSRRKEKHEAVFFVFQSSIVKVAGGPNGPALSLRCGWFGVLFFVLEQPAELAA